MIAARYPNGGEWADKALHSSDPYISRFIVIDHCSNVCGFAITKQRDRDTAKICSLYIAPFYRRRGIGNMVMRQILMRSFHKGFTKHLLTYNLYLADTLGRMISSMGFETIAMSQNKYRSGETEVIACLTSDISPN